MSSNGWRNGRTKAPRHSGEQDFPETALQGDILHHLDGSYYVYVGSKWIPLKEAMNIIYEV